MRYLIKTPLDKCTPHPCGYMHLTEVTLEQAKAILPHADLGVGGCRCYLTPLAPEETKPSVNLGHRLYAMAKQGVTVTILPHMPRSQVGTGKVTAAGVIVEISYTRPSEGPQFLPPVPERYVLQTGKAQEHKDDTDFIDREIVYALFRCAEAWGLDFDGIG